jgi:aromatic-L-amino-acid/L-tryptophan decarboxylase
MPEDLRTEIERLRAAASPLEPDSEARRELGKQALDHALAYLDQVETASTSVVTRVTSRPTGFLS